MRLNTFPVWEIGGAARDLLLQEQDASVIGVTGGGIFLLLSSGWVIFLSYESFRGPLTLNIGESARGKLQLEVNATAKIISEGILFPEAGLMFLVGSARAWHTHPPVLVGSVMSQWLTILKEITFDLLSRGKTSEIGAVLPTVLGCGDATAGGSKYLAQMARVKQALQQRDVSALGQALQVFCGVGRGLTPSGDDLITGFILALNRWGDTLAPELDLEKLNSDVIQIAYQGTTTLAANLIECASRGQADERLLLALDGILTGEPPPDACASYLARWGNSSGLDALVGMALALLAP